MSDSTPFLGNQVPADEAVFWIIPVGDESSAPYVTGQAAAPAAILEASRHVRAYDEEVAAPLLESAPCHTTEPADRDGANVLAVEALEAHRIPVVLGGAPVVSLPGIRALSEQSEEMSLLAIGARAKLSEGEVTKDACDTVVRRAIELENLTRAVLLGLRSISPEDSDILFGEEGKVAPFFSCDLVKGDADTWLEDVIEELASPVYLSIDLSAVDRSVAPSVGLPEPGGFGWWELLKVLRKVTSRRRVAAFDIVDLVAREGEAAGPYAAARIICKMMAYITSGGKMMPVGKTEEEILGEEEEGEEEEEE